jgi:hypothetical protein
MREALIEEREDRTNGGRKGGQPGSKFEQDHSVRGRSSSVWICVTVFCVAWAYCACVSSGSVAAAGSCESRAERVWSYNPRPGGSLVGPSAEIPDSSPCGPPTWASHPVAPPVSCRQTPSELSPPALTPSAICDATRRRVATRDSRSQSAPASHPWSRCTCAAT